MASNIPPPGASKTFLIAAIALGVLATVLAFAFINNSANANHGPKTQLVVAKHDLKPNTAIDPDRDLTIVPIPVEFAALAQQCLPWDSRTNYKGQRINRRILANQPVFLADLAAMGELDLHDNARALTIPADPGIIIPGDYVKILVPRPDIATAAQMGADPSRTPYLVTMIGAGNGYRVLAVGGSLFKTRQQATAADQYESGGSNAKTVTLEVTENQAGEIQRALGNGQQKAILLLCPSPVTATAPEGH